MIEDSEGDMNVVYGMHYYEYGVCPCCNSEDYEDVDSYTIKKILNEILTTTDIEVAHRLAKECIEVCEEVLND